MKVFYMILTPLFYEMQGRQRAECDLPCNKLPTSLVITFLERIFIMKIIRA